MIKPMPYYVVLKEEKTTATDSGIVLTEDADIEAPSIAEVVSIGDHLQEKPLHFKVGNRVLFKRHLYDEVTLDKNPLLIGKFEGIVATLHD